jgi:hypothetical protein
MDRKSMLRGVLVALVVSSLAVGLGLRLTGGVAYADGSCGPGGTLATYQDPNNNCIYNVAAPYFQNDDDKLRINVWPTTPLPGNIETAMVNAIASWNASGAHVWMTLDTSPPDPNYGNPLYIAGTSNGANFTTSCGDAWGQSWYVNPWTKADNGLYHQVKLNSLIFSTCGSVDYWTGVIVHEMGHTLGLAHNGYYNGAVYMRMNASPVHLADGSAMTLPQYTDTYLFNQLYPARPFLCYSQPSNLWCNGMDPSDQSCPAYGQETKYNPYGWVTLYYSGAHCQSNWSKGASTVGGWNIYRIQVNRSSGADGPATTVEDIPYSSTWYGNLIYSPDNSAQSCISYINTSSKALTGFYCTGWH